jgi:hypothetical protein
MACIVLGVASQAQAAPVYLNIADINPAIGGIVGFNGASMQSLGGLDDLRVSVGAAVFANAHFDITGGWAVTNTLIADRDSSGTVTNGDSITANIGAGTFELENPDGVLVTGSFSNAVLNTSVGSSTINISVGTVNGLNMTPGPVLVALNYQDFLPTESLALSVVGIQPGVQVAASAAIPATPFFTGTMAPFGLGQNTPTSGSVDMVAELVVPEPASVGLLGVAALGLVSRRRRDLAKKVAVLAVAAGGVMAMSGSQAQAAIVNMNLSDINAPITGVAGFNGTNVVSLGGIDNFIITGYPTFTQAQFNITSGFTVTSTNVVDTNLNGLADAGEQLFSAIGAGVFNIVNPSGVIVQGSFSQATLVSSVGGSSVTINAANVDGLDLTPGPVLTGLGVLSLNPPEDFSVNVVGIQPGVQVSGVSNVFAGLLSGTLAPFGIGQDPVTSGSVNMSADLIVPEPASLGLVAVGAMGVLARRRRQA